MFILFLSNFFSSDDWLLNNSEVDADPVRVASSRALRSLEELTGMSRMELLKELHSAVSQMRTTSSGKTRLSASSRTLRVDDDLDDFTAAGCVEKLVLLEEMRCEEDSNNKNYNRNTPNSSLRLKMLRSDIFLQIMEAKLM